jgi:hypothetical protein
MVWQLEKATDLFAHVDPVGGGGEDRYLRLTILVVGCTQVI